nr:MAG TPA: hypothetical protein [Caudoviricetes sp.]
MSIKPILFNTEMVRAILDGRKSCTRRIVKGFIPNNAVWGYTAFTPKGCISCRGTFADGYGEKFFKLPYQPGDILYVRESYSELSFGYVYKADGENIDHLGNAIKWHPSIHMPKEAARIWLKVTDVRVERLKDMTDNDALKEGAEGVRCNHAGLGPHGCTDCMNTGWLEPPIVEFMQIWNSTIKKSDLDRYGWDANPYVYVIEFERCENQNKI